MRKEPKYACGHEKWKDSQSGKWCLHEFHTAGKTAPSTGVTSDSYCSQMLWQRQRSIVEFIETTHRRSKLRKAFLRQDFLKTMRNRAQYTRIYCYLGYATPVNSIKFWGYAEDLQCIVYAFQTGPYRPSACLPDWAVWSHHSWHECQFCGTLKFITNISELKWKSSPWFSLCMKHKLAP